MVDPEAPNSPSPQSDPASSQANAASAAEVARRAELLIKSNHPPQHVFLCGTSDSLITFRPKPEDKPIILLFTNIFTARDYIRASGTVAEARHLALDALPGAARNWTNAGAALFGLDRCPRCGTMNAMSLDVLNENDGFLNVWAVCKASQWFRGEFKVREFLQFQSSSRPRARAALAMIRDHIDCSSPYLHELIAVFARVDGDEDTRQASVSRLAEFGPPFSDWDSRWTGASLPASLATATVGLARAFGVELKPKAPSPPDA
jgi:hypothetical protein